MNTWIAFFRGINVGGKNLLPMKQLQDDLQSLKFVNVRTYIQSGNVVFQASERTAPPLAKKIAAKIKTQHGFQPHVLILKKQQLQKAITENPFPDAIIDPKLLHFFFLAAPPSCPDIAAIDKAKAPTETYHLSDGVFYLSAPNGIGRSKLAAGVEKYMGVVTTARNYRTVAAVISLADE